MDLVRTSALVLLLCGGTRGQYPPSKNRVVCKAAVSRTHLLRRAGSASGTEGTAVVRATIASDLPDRISSFVRGKLW